MHFLNVKLCDGEAVRKSCGGYFDVDVIAHIPYRETVDSPFWRSPDPEELLEQPWSHEASIIVDGWLVGRDVQELGRLRL